MGSDLLAALVMLLFAFLICRPVLHGRVPIASDTLSLWAPWSQQAHPPVRNTTLADSAHLYLAWEVFARESVAQGEWPLWDPYSFSGTSFAANSQSRVYYPLSWLLWLLPLSGDIQLLALFNVLLAGTGMYLFSRALGVSWTGSVLAGLTFAGSGMLQTAVDVPGVASAYGWLPWLVFTSERALVTRSMRWTGVAALTFGLQAVSGHLQWALYAYFAAGCWMLFRSLGLWAADNRRIRTIAGSLGRSALILASGPSLAAVHLVPFLELTSLAGRTGVKVSSHSDPLFYLLRLILPNYFGTPLAVPNFPLGSSNLWYCGVLPLFLAVAAIFLRPRGVVLFWAALALLAVLVTYGVGPFLYVRWLPGLQATLPVRSGFLLVAGVAVLSGLGLDAWVQASTLAFRRAALTLGAVTVCVLLVFASAMYGWCESAAWTLYSIPVESREAMRAVQWGELVRAGLISLVALAGLGLLLAHRFRAGATSYALRVRRLIPSALVILTVVDLLLMLPNYSSFVEPSVVVPPSVSVRWLRQQPGVWRMMGLGGEAVVPSFVPNSQLLYGLQSVDGYDSLHSRLYDEFWETADAGTNQSSGGGPYGNVFVRPQAYTSTAASLLGVKYVVSVVPVQDAILKEVFRGDTIIYENLLALPRAYVVPVGRVLPKADLLRRLSGSDFDAQAEVLFESDVPVPRSQEPAASKIGKSEAGIALYRRNRVDVRVSSSLPGWLVLADSAYPGWQATVDGSEAPLYTADHLLRAVRITAGDHLVSFRFTPTNFYPALGVSLFTLLLVLAAILWPRRGLTRNGGR